MLRHILLMCVVLICPTLATAQISYLTQFRSIDGYAEVFNDLTGDGGGDEQFASSVGFMPFSDALLAEWYEEFGTAIANSDQTSSLLSASMDILGSAEVLAEVYEPDWTAGAVATSNFEVDFEVTATQAFTFSGMTETSGPGNIDYQLRDFNGVPIFQLFISGVGFTPVLESGTLTPGTYTLIVEAFVDVQVSAAGDFWGGLASFDLSFDVTPEASAVGDNLAATRYLTAGPNPMHGSTTIAYATGRTGNVELDVFDLRGHRVRTLTSSSVASGQVSWDGTNDRGQDVPQGTYFVVMRGGDEVVSRKVSVVR